MIMLKFNFWIYNIQGNHCAPNETYFIIDEIYLTNIFIICIIKPAGTYVGVIFPNPLS